MVLDAVTVVVQDKVGKGPLGMVVEVPIDAAFEFIRKAMVEGLVDPSGNTREGRDLRFVVIAEVTSHARFGLLPHMRQPTPATYD